ncbi:hypothetical protein [Flavobacterium sp.]|uniref:hypothetical protein n=1 Tax=Flavobacterium sp. TaxID=239 RepID=UPI0039E681D3
MTNEEIIYYENLKGNPSLNIYLFDKLFSVINGITVAKPNISLQLIDGIPMAYNTFTDTDTFSSLFPEGLSAPSFENNFQDLSSENSIENNATQYALSSPFKENSIFHPNYDKSKKEEEENRKKEKLIKIQLIKDINSDELNAASEDNFKFGWWSTDYEGKKKVPSDQYHLYRSNLEKTVYFQIEVNPKIPSGTSIRFQLYDFDGMFNFDDKTFAENEIIKTAVVRTVNKEKRITIELFLSPNWGSDIAIEKGLFANGSIELYWQWEFKNVIWSSKQIQLNVYPSLIKLHIKPVLQDEKFNLPEFYSRLGDLILFAIERLPNGEIKKFVSIAIRNTTTYKSIEDVNKFLKEVYTERINLDTNEIEAAGYEVTELNNYFKIKNNATSIFIEEEKITVPVEKGTKLAVYNSLNKGIALAKNAAKGYGHYQVIKETINMFPELSYNSQFNMPSLSTFVGLIRGAEVIAFALMVTEWVIKDQMKEDEETINQFLSIDWQNAKKKGLDNALNFIQKSNWARENGFTSILIAQENLDSLLKGEYNALEELIRASFVSENPKIYVVFTYRVTNEKLDTYTDVVDCIYLNYDS